MVNHDTERIMDAIAELRHEVTGLTAGSARIEERVGHVLETQDDHEKRVRFLETTGRKFAGVVLVLQFVVLPVAVAVTIKLVKGGG